MVGRRRGGHAGVGRVGGGRRGAGGVAGRRGGGGRRAGGGGTNQSQNTYKFCSLSCAGSVHNFLHRARVHAVITFTSETENRGLSTFQNLSITASRYQPASQLVTKADAKSIIQKHSQPASH